MTSINRLPIYSLFYVPILFHILTYDHLGM